MWLMLGGREGSGCREGSCRKPWRLGSPGVGGDMAKKEQSTTGKDKSCCMLCCGGANMWFCELLVFEKF